MAQPKCLSVPAPQDVPLHGDDELGVGELGKPLAAPFRDFGTEADFATQASGRKENIRHFEPGRLGDSETTREAEPEDEHIALWMATGSFSHPKQVAKLGGGQGGGPLGHGDDLVTWLKTCALRAHDVGLA